MFLYDDGLRLPSVRLSIDVPRRQSQSFVSHAHGDHMARHELAYATPATAALYCHRLGQRRVQAMAYGQPLQLGDCELTALPAGHMLGSAMLLVESERRLLYTGDFCLTPGKTAGPAVELPRADVLVMESTFGAPRFCLPPRADAESQLLELVAESLKRGQAPLIHAYAAGKAQEICSLLHANGIPTLQHPSIAAISRIYHSQGCDCGDIVEYQGVWRPDAAVIVPPRAHRQRYIPFPARKTTIAATGWAVLPETRRGWQVDHAVALSDHADFSQLLQCVERVSPRIVFCTHGPESFVAELRQRGWNAFPLNHRSAARWQELLKGARRSGVASSEPATPRTGG